jgi:hypothetical protein
MLHDDHSRVLAAPRRNHVPGHTVKYGHRFGFTFAGHLGSADIGPYRECVTDLAAVVLAHTDPSHLRRLVHALEDIPIVLHCDARTPEPVFSAMTRGLPKRVRLTERVRTKVASWSLVRAELTAVRDALEWTSAKHIAVLSGADYPLMSMDDIATELKAWEGRSWIENTPLPTPIWNTPRQRDGGLWRLRYRYLVHDDQVLYWRGYPLRMPWQRDIPADLSLRAASQWKVYDRSHVSALLSLVENRPDLIRFWRTTLVPDESFAASMLGSRRLLGDDSLRPCPAGAWYLDWNNEDAGHPRWLSGGDFDRLEVARRAPRTTPESTHSIESIHPIEPGGYRRLFARKFRSSDHGVVDRVEAELRR